MAANDEQREVRESSQDSTQIDEGQTEKQLSTPPGEVNGADGKTSRKREREVSLEPATPQATTLDIDPERPEVKERRTPAKKNRTSDSVLEAPQEEAEDDATVLVNGSPPHETKIRQISQGVEDLTWQNMKKDETTGTVPETQMGEITSKTDEDVAVSDVSQEAPGAETTADEDVTSQPDELITVPPLMRGENPPILNDTAGEDEDTGAAAGAEQPPDSHVAEAPLGQSSGTKTSPSQTPLPETPRFPFAHRRGSDSSDQEKGLKRKLGDRTVSECLVPGEIPDGNGMAAVGAIKRPRDDAEEDPNTREKKRPTPPPEEDENGPERKVATPPVDTAPKQSGFMAYASTSSPFANVTGPRVFGAKQPSTSSWSSATTSGSSSANAFTSDTATSPFSSYASSPSPFAAAAKDANSSASTSAGLASAPQAHKRTGFEAFASSTSPFASAAKRPKSPPPSANVLGRSRSPSRHGTPARATSAFSAYAVGGAQGFAPTPKRTALAFGEGPSSGNARGGGNGSVLDAGKDEGEDSEKEKDKRSAVSFGERLRASKDREEDEASDEDKKLNLTEQEVFTGEEEEDTVYQVRGKLFALSSQNQWKERGTGTLRLNVRRQDGGGARIVMRKEAVYAVLLNATLFKGMRCFLAQDPRYLRFSVFEDGTATHYNLRVSNAKIAEELLEEINAHIPTD